MRILTSVGLLGITGLAVAQPKFVPDQEIRKVGEIVFQQPYTTTFSFTNKGNKPLVITDVHPACGCTKVEYPEGNIAPGEKGEIKATYDAAVLGTFSKYFEVYTNAGDNPEFVSMQGRVVTSINNTQGNYPVDLGNVRMSGNYVEFDNVNKGDHPTVDIIVYNTEHAPFRPQLMHLPPYLQVQYLPQDIPAGRTGRIRLTLDSENLPTMGLNQFSVYLARYLGDKVSEENEIQVSAVLLPSFSNLTAQQLAVAPVMNVSTTELDMPALGKKKTVSQSMTITNSGKSALTIQQVQVFNRALSIALSDKTIAPGGHATLKVSVSASLLKRAKARPRVLLVSDDPHHSVETININIPTESDKKK